MFFLLSKHTKSTIHKSSNTADNRIKISGKKLIFEDRLTKNFMEVYEYVITEQIKQSRSA